MPNKSDKQINSNIITHFYRSERQRADTWRERLDATTNWAVIITAGILTFVFSKPNISHFTLILGMFLLLIFLSIESRRYRFFDVWRSRLRLLEGNFIISALGKSKTDGEKWKEILIDDIKKPKFKITWLEAFTRRLRRIYNWLVSIFIVAWFWKLAVHPTPVGSFFEMAERANIGSIPGRIVIIAVILIWIFMISLSFYERGEREAKEKIEDKSEGKFDWDKDTNVK